MNEKYIINFSSLDSLKEKFENDKKNFTNSSYSTFSSSYIKKCSDYNIQQMSNQLDKLYLKIKESYEKMDKWLIEYINNTKGIEAKLSNKSGYSQISDSSLISQINNIKKLPTVTYDVKSSFNVKKSNNNAFSSTLETRNKVTTPSENFKKEQKINIDRKLYSDKYIYDEFLVNKYEEYEKQHPDEEIEDISANLESMKNIIPGIDYIQKSTKNTKKIIIYGSNDGIKISCGDKNSFIKCIMKNRISLKPHAHSSGGSSSATVESITSGEASGNFLEQYISFGATWSMSIFEGIGKAAEGLFDLGVSLGTGTARIIDGKYGAVRDKYTKVSNGETTTSFEEWLDDYKQFANANGFEFEYVDDGYYENAMKIEKLANLTKKEHVKELFDSFYETDIGKSIKSKSSIYDQTRAVGSSVGYMVPSILLTIVTGGAGASQLVATGAGATSMAVTSSGTHIEGALNDGAGYGDATKVGILNGILDGASYFAGSNVSQVSSKIFSSISNNVARKILVSATNVAFDVTDGASSALTEPLLKTLYMDGYTDQKTGEYIKFSDDENFFDRLKKTFESTGGMESVKSNALVAGLLSSFSELADLRSIFKKEKNDININNPNMADNNNLKSIEKNKVRRVNTKSSISDSLEKFDNAIRLKDDNDIKSFFGTHREFNDPRYAFTYSEINEREGYVEVAGPVIGAYLRGSDVDFYTKRGVRQIYHADKESLKVYLEQMHGRGYYMDKNDYKSIVESMDNIIKKSSPLQEDTILYRGVNSLFFKGEKLNINSIKVGDLINDKAFMSTSVIKDACYDQNDIILEILAPKGTKGTYLGKNAKEWLLSRNTTLKILSKPEQLVNGKFVIKAEIYSQTPIEKIKNVFNKFSRQSDVSKNLTQQQNVVRDMDLSNNKHLTSKSNYNNLFNKLNGGVDVDDFVDYMEKKGLMANYEDKIIDIDNLYRRGSKIAEHDVSHVERVMLYSMYMGDKLNLSEHNMDLLAQAAKYHDVGVYAGHSGHSYVSANEVVENLKGKYSTSDVNKIAAIIEYHEVDELGRKFDDLLAKSNMSISHDLSLNDFRKNLSDNNKNELDKVISKLSGIVDISDMSTVDFKNIIDSEDFQNFANICRKYSIPMDDIMDVKEIADILKDADAIDRTRFINNLNVNYFRNKDLANSLVKTSYQMQEIRGKLELDKILAEGTSLDKIQKINLYRNKGVPDYLIDFAIKYKSGNIDNFIEQYMRRN